ncbi:MAG: prolipoprotein diacylglyceryl transferase [Desulfobacterales bacterium]
MAAARRPADSVCLLPDVIPLMNFCPATGKNKVVMTTFWDWWQHIPQRLDPVIFEIGSFKLQYYGLMYVVAFVITYALAMYRVKREKKFDVSKEQIQALVTYMMLGVIVGGRLGYVIFYNLAYYVKHPLEIILPFDFSNGVKFIGITGMSFHGGLICVILFAWWYARKAGLNFLSMADLFIPCIPLGYTFGRIGNFINGELYGRVTAMPFGMYFPQAADMQLRHPSQLYEAFFEGLFLFGVLWSLRKILRTRGAMLALYLAGYGTVRFFIEYFRQPDEHLGFVLWQFSMGQILCLVMLAGGISLYGYFTHKEKTSVSAG